MTQMRIPGLEGDLTQSLPFLKVTLKSIIVSISSHDSKFSMHTLPFTYSNLLKGLIKSRSLVFKNDKFMY